MAPRPQTTAIRSMPSDFVFMTVLSARVTPNPWSGETGPIQGQSNNPAQTKYAIDPIARGMP